MSNERERLAREWATSTLPKGDAKTQAAIEHIMATTKEPTMEGVEWDGDKHFLAGAILDTEESEEEMVMCGYTRDGEIYVVEPDGEKRGYWPMPCDLTPNGKRYELREVTAPEHPETLTTVEDYEGAPIGTVVTRKGCEPWTKRDSEDWRVTGGPSSRMDYHMANSKRDVLRWGWGE